MGTLSSAHGMCLVHGSTANNSTLNLGDCAVLLCRAALCLARSIKRNSLHPAPSLAPAEYRAASARPHASRFRSRSSALTSGIPRMPSTRRSSASGSWSQPFLRWSSTRRLRSSCQPGCIKTYPSWSSWKSPARSHHALLHDSFDCTGKFGKL